MININEIIEYCQNKKHSYIDYPLKCFSKRVQREILGEENE